jgi:hypothetical protein
VLVAEGVGRRQAGTASSVGDLLDPGLVKLSRCVMVSYIVGRHEATLPSQLLRIRM